MDGDIWLGNKERKRGKVEGGNKEAGGRKEQGRGRWIEWKTLRRERKESGRGRRGRRKKRHEEGGTRRGLK